MYQSYNIGYIILISLQLFLRGVQLYLHWKENSLDHVHFDGDWFCVQILLWRRFERWANPAPLCSTSPQATATNTSTTGSAQRRYVFSFIANRFTCFCHTDSRRSNIICRQSFVFLYIERHEESVRNSSSRNSPQLGAFRTVLESLQLPHSAL